MPSQTQAVKHLFYQSLTDAQTYRTGQLSRYLPTTLVYFNVIAILQLEHYIMSS